MKSKLKWDDKTLLGGCILLCLGVVASILYAWIYFTSPVSQEVAITQIEFEEVKSGKNEFITYNEKKATVHFILTSMEDSVRYLLKVENRGNREAVFDKIEAVVDKELSWFNSKISLLDTKQHPVDTISGTALGAGEVRYIEVIVEKTVEENNQAQKGKLELLISYQSSKK